MSDPSVAQAVVTVFEDHMGEKQLVGYVRPAPGTGSVPMQELREHLSGWLPAYMVPSHIVVLDAFPLNPSGKIDRKALPNPDASTSRMPYVAPTTALELLLADTYATLVGLERVGAEDSFFDIGGNSLQAMKLVTNLREDLDVDVALPSVFLAPTPRDLAAMLCKEYGLEDAPIDDLSVSDADRV
jgi:acyl carrier protein